MIAVKDASPSPLLAQKSFKTFPELVVKHTRRRTRIFTVALTFVMTYLLDYPLDSSNDFSSSSSSSSPSNSFIKSKQDDRNTIQEVEKIRIFYNLFTKSAEDEQRVKRIVEEQFTLVDPKLHNTNISISSIGYQLSSSLADATLGDASYHIHQHHNEGGEDLTLHTLWNYCQSHPHKDVKVIYLHSKGSYHPNEANTKLRNFVSRGALSSECANLPTECNVCSSRFSPLPHPHTSGNMWLARCEYISQLIDPLAAKEGKLPERVHEDNPCKGRGRYLGEHWVHSHPSVKPCDLYPGKEFTWAHLRVPPVGPLKKELQMAPRFKFVDYVLPGMCMEDHPETLQIQDFMRLRRENYELLYNMSDLEEDWWGWRFLKRSIAREDGKR